MRQVSRCAQEFPEDTFNSSGMRGPRATPRHWRTAAHRHSASKTLAAPKADPIAALLKPRTGLMAELEEQERP
jgi:hypothetical protein